MFLRGVVYTRCEGWGVVKKLRIYLETTIFNRYVEPERDNHRETKVLFDEIAEGKFDAFTSGYVLRELKQAPAPA